MRVQFITERSAIEFEAVNAILDNTINPKLLTIICKEDEVSWELGSALQKSMKGRGEIRLIEAAGMYQYKSSTTFRNDTKKKAPKFVRLAFLPA